MSSSSTKVNIEGGSWLNGLQLVSIFQTSAQTQVIQRQTKDLRESHEIVHRTLIDIAEVQKEISSLSSKLLNVQERTLGEQQKQTKLQELSRLERNAERELKHTVFEFRKQAERISKVELAIERLFLFRACINSMDGMREPFKYLTEIPDKEYLSATYEIVKEGVQNAERALTEKDNEDISVLNSLIKKANLVISSNLQAQNNQQTSKMPSKNPKITLWRSVVLLLSSVFGIGFFASSEGEDLTPLDTLLFVIFLLSIIMIVFVFFRWIFSKKTTNSKVKNGKTFDAREGEVTPVDELLSINNWLENYESLRESFSAEDFIPHQYKRKSTVSRRSEKLNSSKIKTNVQYEAKLYARQKLRDAGRKTLRRALGFMMKE